MFDVDVVVLSKFPEILQGFRDSVDADAPELSKICVWDNRVGSLERYQKWSTFIATWPFQMARNANLGWRASNKDISYAGDDTRIIEPRTIVRLQELAYSDPHLGILSPRIIGHAQAFQINPTVAPITFTPYVAFVFVYIKRAVIDEIGYLDERFEGYGMEDLVFCYRARKVGFKCGVAKEIAVKHGYGEHTYGSTFIRVKGELQMGKDDKENRRLYAEKWGLPDDAAAIFEAIDRG